MRLDGQTIDDRGVEGVWADFETAAWYTEALSECFSDDWLVMWFY
jgi:hypothetical protein